MANTTPQEFRILVPQLVAELYQRRHSPVPGAVLKLEIIRRVAEEGKYFDQSTIGAGNFYDLVSSCDVTVERRLGSDFVVFPKSAFAAGERIINKNGPAVAETVQPSVRLQRDIWYAFVSFPVPGIRRSFDPVTHRVVYEDESLPLGGKVIIEPISVEQQLKWRKEFAASVSGPEAEELAKAIKAQNPFKDFSRWMRQRPGLGKEWNLFLLKKVVPIVEQWADHNKISREQWLQVNKPKTEDDSNRRELYQFLDSIAIDDLLNLQIPLRLVVGRSRRTE